MFFLKKNFPKEFMKNKLI